MRSIEEIDRDLAGMNESCKHRTHGCAYPACNCPRASAAAEPARSFDKFVDSFTQELIEAPDSVFAGAAAAPQPDTKLRAALVEARRWIGDGDLGDGMHRSIRTPRYAAAVDMVDAALAATAAPSVEVPDLHQQIMNLPVGSPGWAGNDLLLYKEGHKAARHAAAELVAGAVAAPSGVPAEPITVAALAKAADRKALPIMRALNVFGGDVTLNQPLDIALIGAALCNAGCRLEDAAAPSGGVPAAHFLGWLLVQRDGTPTSRRSIFQKEPSDPTMQHLCEHRDEQYPEDAPHRWARVVIEAGGVPADTVPVAFVPVHPRHGPLWANTVPSMDSDRPKHYPVMSLFAAAAPAQSADMVLLSDINELAKVYASIYASPHHITFTVEGLRSLIAAAAGAPTNPDSVHEAAPQADKVHSGSAPANAPSGEGSAA